MAHLRGVEVGKILLTSDDVLEHCYPQMHKRLQALKDVPPPAEAAPPPPPAATSSKRSKKAKVEAQTEEPAERNTLPAPEPTESDVVEPDPFKDV